MNPPDLACSNPLTPTRQRLSIPLWLLSDESHATGFFDPSMTMLHLQRLHTLSDIAADEWNSLVPEGNPFLSHEFLSALERHHCVSERLGWIPWHLLCRGEDGHLLGAAPLYLKFNSYGEFVFDGRWAQAYQQQGLRYYPKLVGAIPYTPATSPRFLLADHQAHPTETLFALIDAALEESQRQQLSSIHWLFPLSAEVAPLLERGFMRRLGCQFHWHNQGYRDFQDFLDTLTAKRRKTINRERRRVREAGLELQILHGSEMSEAQWQRLHQFYCDTHHRLGGIPTLTQSFFQDIGSTLGQQVVLVIARAQGREVAGAISFRSNDTLYGRHWGCHLDYDSLHFEACYYQSLEYCIQQGLQRFEPGAQGEHKIQRGFLPTLTQSAHWIAHPSFRQAIQDFLIRETPAVHTYACQLLEHSPYRDEVTPDEPAMAGSTQ